MPEYRTPDWYNKEKLTKVCFNRKVPEQGWVIDMGEGLYRLANTPLDGMIDPKGPQWGDLVQITKAKGIVEIIERYDKNVDLIGD